MRKLTPDELVAFFDVASDLRVAKPKHLWGLIQFESGWNPLSKNPGSSARGLIGFMDSTARYMGFADSSDLIYQYNTIESQLRGPVKQYLGKFSPFDNDQELYMSVFYPRARNWPESQEFPPKVQDANPGIVTVGDYLTFARRHAEKYPYEREEENG